MGGMIICTYIKLNDTITRPSNTRREVRDATAQEQPTDTHAAVSSTGCSKIEIAQIAEHIVPDGASPDGHRGLVLAQHRRVQILHVDGDAALDIGGASSWRVTAALDGELASGHP